MFVRVYQPVGDAPCRVVWPNESQRLQGEADRAFVARIGALTEIADPTLAGVPFIDIDENALPGNRIGNSNGTADLDTRFAWRVVGPAVVVVPGKSRPRRPLDP